VNWLVAPINKDLLAFLAGVGLLILLSSRLSLYTYFPSRCKMRDQNAINIDPGTLFGCVCPSTLAPSVRWFFSTNDR